jgi:hypothetical protein
MTDMPDTPLPAGGLARLDQERAVEFVNLLVDRDVASELIRQALSKGAHLALDMFDEQGWSRLGIVSRCGEKVKLLGRIHWSAMLPETQAVEMRPGRCVLRWLDSGGAQVVPRRHAL